MVDNFNGLTAAETERLAMLAEEAGEIAQMVGKILRHGYESFHPDDKEQVTNRVLLRNEINDLVGVVHGMVLANDLSPLTFYDADAAWQRKLKYSHHQNND